ncbi:hypothetical protein JVT61DRAFT_13730 [Boletus reticuloceps]|uniref:Uncharacterized protein n=1 Tax=Boletus reticuloceps TaxID=495285 RepID=A0A8I3AD55_9AGAM|nr:hypothetical protein JVT61DRAFT_13730 [Boletus reticuloceps]
MDSLFRAFDDVQCCGEGTLIPAGEDIERFEVQSDVSWVLVVEKEVCYYLIELD